jgi:hypothetical protein
MHIFPSVGNDGICPAKTSIPSVRGLLATAASQGPFQIIAGSMETGLAHRTMPQKKTSARNNQ